jgi:hypothetical protein
MPLVSPPLQFIYCCENDHGMVEELGKTLKGKATVVTCMVDRICTGRTVEGNQVLTTSEPHQVRDGEDSNHSARTQRRHRRRRLLTGVSRVGVLIVYKRVR